MKIESTTFKDYGTLTLAFKPRGEKLVNETSGGEAEAQAKFEEFISGRLDRLLRAVVLGLEISCLLVPEPEESSENVPHDDGTQNPDE